MRKRLAPAFMTVALVFLTAAAAIAGGHTVINAEELKEMMADGSAIVIVDVREPELYTRGHLPGAINIPYDGAHDRVLKELKPGERIVFVCHGGPMGDDLGTLLVNNGYKEVYNLEGGMRRWRGEIER